MTDETGAAETGMAETDGWSLDADDPFRASLLVFISDGGGVARVPVTPEMIEAFNALDLVQQDLVADEPPDTLDTPDVPAEAERPPSWVARATGAAQADAVLSRATRPVTIVGIVILVIVVVVLGVISPW